jgi:hypothetical protein
MTSKEIETRDDIIFKVGLREGYYTGINDTITNGMQYVDMNREIDNQIDEIINRKEF